MNQTLARRSFLRVMGLAPIAAKMAAEDAVGKAAAINTSGIGNYGQGASIAGPMNVSPAQYRLAFASKSFRKICEAELFVQNRHIPFLDHDLAQKRSFSLAAKIAFQRQRNVSRHIEHLQSDYQWERLPKLVMQFLGVKGN